MFLSKEKQKMYELNVSSVWRNSSGVWRTRDLFYEFATKDKRDCVYAALSEKSIEERLKEPLPIFYLGDDDAYITAPNGETVLYYSLKKIYLSYTHIPGEEYEFANEVLGGWTHWQKILSTSVLKREIEEWRKEYLIKTKCAAGRQIINLALGDGKDVFQASKYVLAKGWGLGDAKENKRINKQINDEVEEDMGRVFKMISGEKK